jgi:hypothetical protein
MGRMPRIGLAGLLTAGLALTGCESGGLFGARKSWRQDQVATAPANPSPTTGSTNNTAASAGWQNMPKGLATTSPDATPKAWSTTGQPIGVDGGQPRPFPSAQPSTGFPSVNTTPGQTPAASTTGGFNSPAPAGNRQGFDTTPQSATPSPVSPAPGPQSALPNQDGAARDTHYQTQYPTVNEVKKMPLPGQGDE